MNLVGIDQYQKIDTVQIAEVTEMTREIETEIAKQVERKMKKRKKNHLKTSMCFVLFHEYFFLFFGDEE